MLNQSFVALTLLTIGVHSRPNYWVFKEERGDLTPQYVIEDQNFEETVFSPRVINKEVDEARYQVPDQHLDSLAPFEGHVRNRRQIKTTVHIPDQKLDISGSTLLTKTNKDAVAAFGGVSGIKPGHFDATTAGMAYENAKGHGLTAAASHIPTLGNQLSLGGKLNLANTPNHKLDANAFASRTFTNQPNLPNFNTYGGSLDYSFRDKIGASLGAKTIPAFDRTDYSAMGKLNIFKTPSSSFDFGAGYQRTHTPNYSFGQPLFDMTYSRSF